MRFPTNLELTKHQFITTHSQQVINPSLISVKKNARFFFSRYYCYKVASDISMSDTTFWKYSLRIFQGCCLLFNYQGSMLFFVVSLATAILDYHSFRHLSTTFLNYFFAVVFVISLSLDSSIRLPYLSFPVNNFFIFFIFLYFSLYFIHLREVTYNK